MSLPPHLGGSYPDGDGNTIMKDVWGYLIVRYRIRSLLDIGCGYGHAMKFFADNLISVTGIDGDPACAESPQQCPGCVITHDYATGPCQSLGSRHFDLAWSAEFLEHVEERYLPSYMLDFQRCQNAVVTHASPGQNGHHHVNCQDDNYWILKFTEAGFLHDEAETRTLRLTDRWHASWGRCSLLFFRNLRHLALPQQL